MRADESRERFAGNWLLGHAFRRSRILDGLVPAPER